MLRWFHWYRDRCKSCGALVGSSDNRWNCPMARGTERQWRWSLRRPHGFGWRREGVAPLPSIYQDTRLVDGDDFDA